MTLDKPAYLKVERRTLYHGKDISNLTVNQKGTWVATIVGIPGDRLLLFITVINPRTTYVYIDTYFSAI